MTVQYCTSMYSTVQYSTVHILSYSIVNLRLYSIVPPIRGLRDKRIRVSSSSSKWHSLVFACHLLKTLSQHTTTAFVQLAVDGDAGPVEFEPTSSGCASGWPAADVIESAACPAVCDRGTGGSRMSTRSQRSATSAVAIAARERAERPPVRTLGTLETASASSSARAAAVRAPSSSSEGVSSRRRAHAFESSSSSQRSALERRTGTDSGYIDSIDSSRMECTVQYSTVRVHSLFWTSAAHRRHPGEASGALRRRPLSDRDYKAWEATGGTRIGPVHTISRENWRYVLLPVLVAHFQPRVLTITHISFCLFSSRSSVAWNVTDIGDSTALVRILFSSFLVERHVGELKEIKRKFGNLLKQLAKVHVNNHLHDVWFVNLFRLYLFSLSEQVIFSKLYGGDWKSSCTGSSSATSIPLSSFLICLIRFVACIHVLVYMAYVLISKALNPLYKILSYL